ncbi:hypothetical protein V7127_14325 [Bacillus sp. JJ1773]|uniref:hypothetical protein n=1 Tax=Bacillus sp. JJ1773 TaxID=3122965 RepID=UPI003000BC51
MKDKIKSFEEFEQRFKNQKLPEVQHNEYLSTNAIERKKVPIFLRASFISIFLTVSISVSIAAAMHFTEWKFLNSEGKQVFEMKTMTEEEAEPHHKYDEIYRKYRTVMDEIKKDIPKGQFKYFLTVEGYEEIGGSGLTMLYNGEEVKSVTQIPYDIREFLHLKDELQNELVLKSGLIYYEIPNTKVDLAEEMYKEAKENNLSYIIKDGNLTSDISNLFLHYESKIMSVEEGRHYQIIISPVREEMHTTENLAGFINVKRDGIDFLYSREHHKIYFIKEDTSRKFLISISTSWREENFVEKEEQEGLIEIAKAFFN